MGRRGHGEGSVYQRKDGRWVACITLENHKRKYFYGDTRREVQEALKKALHEQQQGTLATGPQQTLKAYLEQWLDQVYKPTVRLNTYRQYRSIIRHHIVPALGHIAVQKLTAEKVQAFYAGKQQEGSAAGTIGLIHSVLHKALENAVKWGLVSRNVTKLVTKPRMERYEGTVLTVEQAKRLLDVAQGSRLESLLVVALATGMRRGELLALHWDDVDLKKGVVYVRRTMSHITGHSYVESEPKTRAGRRKIVLPDVAIEAFRKHQEAQDQMRAKVGVKWQERGIVFCNYSGGFFNPTQMAFEFKKLLKLAGLPDMRFHDLRHSAATFLLAAGVHPKVVQERMGHSSIVMTMNIYSHVLPSMQQEAADRIDDIFKGS